MKLLTYQTQEGLRLGVKTDLGILDVTKAWNLSLQKEHVPQTMEQLLQGGNSALSELSAFVQQILNSGQKDLFYSEDELTIGPCVPRPGKIICVGLNYRSHVEESNMELPDYPVLFSKFNNAIAAHNERIQLPLQAEQIDYEAELAIVIGKRAKAVTKEKALDHVFGYCCGNDLSARDWQFRTPQWLLGKSCDGFCPVGPYLVTADEIENPNNLRIRCYVNGELRQDSHTSKMIFPCDELISYISHHMTLQPGDLILTGTPEGVILGYPKEKQVWLQAGDLVTVEIEKVGFLSNTLAKEQ